MGRLPGMLLLSLLAGAAGAQQSTEIGDWLDRMAMAVNNLNYSGALVYQRGSQVDALRIYHRVDENGMKERLVALNGPPREVLRDNQSVRCIFSNSQAIVVDTRIAERLFPLIPSVSALPEGRYHVSLDGSDRIAELDAQILSILPRDDFRYGYRLWLEKNTGMLLKSALLDIRGQPMEQLMFTEIQIGQPISDRDLVPDLPGDGYVQVEIPKSTESAGVAPETVHWRVIDVPAGFVLSSHRHGGSRESLEHMVFSDGLASVSVYVEPTGDNEPGLSGHSRMGAVNMFGRTVQGFSITAVGEVPPSTVRMMARSVQRTAAAAVR